MAGAKRVKAKSGGLIGKLRRAIESGQSDGVIQDLLKGKAVGADKPTGAKTVKPRKFNKGGMATKAKAKPVKRTPAKSRAYNKQVKR